MTTISDTSPLQTMVVDGLSRLPLPSTLPDLYDQCETFNIAQVQVFPVTFGGIQKATICDTILSKVYHYV